MHKVCIDGDRIFVIRAFCTEQECEAFVAGSESGGYQDATINTVAGVRINREIRNNARMILDDPSLADRLWQRLQPFVPTTLEDWQVLGLNERFRFYRYDPGQRFAPHFDGSFERATGERSHLTFMVYLNDDFTGGETKFYDINQRDVCRATVRPERGMALVFAHLQLHEGAPVLDGRKYVLRTDVMYAPESLSGRTA